MKTVIKTVSIKILIAVIAIQIINLSIDGVDFQPMAARVVIEDFNYLNSMTEYVSEIILGKKDAFPEFQKESSSSKSQIIKYLSLKIPGKPLEGLSNNFTICKSSFIVPLKEKYEYSYFNEINPPPPRLV